jgi:hypothetical protein
MPQADKKSNYRSSTFTLACCFYLATVIAAFIFGVLKRDCCGGSFLPAVALTFPWFLISTIASVPRWLFTALTSFYDLPLFLLSAFLNVCLAELLRRFFTSRS